jgi:hypothetical protein
MALIDDLLTELTATTDIVAPILEGYRDLLRTNLTDEARAIAQRAHDVYAGYLGGMTAARDANEHLHLLGYPTLPRFAVPRPQHGDLIDQRRTIDAALGQMDVEEVAATATVTFSEPTPKATNNP